MMYALKEWATVVKALEQGKQTVILRKGGILETASGFNIESKKFFLFPTWEHQETKHVKPEFHDFLNSVLNKKPKEGFNKITSYAEILFEKDIESNHVINNLSPLSCSADAVLASPSATPSAVGVSPSLAPSAPSSVSAGFSGSLIIVGAARVATTKSLP